MVIVPNDLFSWNNKYSKYNVTNTFTLHTFFLAMHVNLLCACSHLEAMKGKSSLTSCHFLILSHLSSSLVWAQLTLFVPALGAPSPSLQNGAPIHRVRAHPLIGIRNTNNGFHHKMLPAERLGLSKRVCPGGFRHLFNFVVNFFGY